MRLLTVALLLTSPIVAQVPQGWYVFGTFAGAGSALDKGVFMAHPRTPQAATRITGMFGDLGITGSACVLYREQDNAILVGERSPAGASVDLHVLQIQGSAVVSDHSISVGTGGPCCGEIPQMALLPDGRVVVAVTDLVGGPLQNYLSRQYGWQGLGIVDTKSGLVTSIAVSNGATIPDVFNALALSPDGQTVYVGTYDTNTSGNIYHVPLAGGAATHLVNLPGGISNMAFANDGYLMVTDAYTAQGLFRVDVSNGSFVAIPHSSGALNGLANESVTGNYAAVSGGAGLPSRSVFWVEPNGTDHVLDSPIGIATPSGVAIHLNPARFGLGTAAGNSYEWQLAPNPGGLPKVGNTNFSLTVAATGSTGLTLGVGLIAQSRLASAVPILGVDLWLDPTTILATPLLPALPIVAIPLPIPNIPGLVDLALFVQTVHQETGGALAASPGVRFTIV